MCLTILLASNHYILIVHTIAARNTWTRLAYESLWIVVWKQRRNQWPVATGRCGDDVDPTMLTASTTVGCSAVSPFDVLDGKSL